MAAAMVVMIAIIADIIIETGAVPEIVQIVQEIVPGIVPGIVQIVPEIVPGIVRIVPGRAVSLYIISHVHKVMNSFCRCRENRA